MRQVAFNIRARVCASLVASAILCVSSTADEAIAREDQLKAAYLINFAQFVHWPATADNTLTICFHGADGVREALERAIASKKTIGGGVLAVRSIGQGSGVAGCKVLFMARGDAKAAGLVGEHRNEPVLTVSDINGFVRGGGMIELFNDNNRLRFRINAGTAETAGLQISSDLLQLAASVERGTPR
jgi:hypothetical protein